MFLRPDDHFILMDVPNAAGRLFNDDELSALRDAGMTITMMFMNNLKDLEPVRGEYQWGEIDSYIERALRHGYRVFIPTYTAAPAWAPETWWVKTENGGGQGVLSPWNQDAQEYLLNHYRCMVEHCASSEVVVVNTQLTHGETLLLNEAAWFGPDAIASYEEHAGAGARPCKNVDVTEDWLQSTYFRMMRTQAEVLARQPVKVLYTAIHPMIAQFAGMYGNGCRWYDDLLMMYRNFFPDHEILWVLYTFIQWGHMHPTIMNTARRLRVDVFGGAEYAEGLPHTTPAAKAVGLRGQFIGPCHHFTGHTQVEPWMLDNIKAAVKVWQG